MHVRQVPVISKSDKLFILIGSLEFFSLLIIVYKKIKNSEYKIKKIKY